MQRYKLAGCAAVLLFVFSSPGRSDDTPLGPFAFTEDPRHLISLLSDPDPAVRADSGQKLIAVGEAARPPLRRALATVSLQTRSEIDRVLLHVPWIKHGDNEAVEQAFTGYAELDADERCKRIDAVWPPEPPELRGPPAALMRIIMNDPCTAVRWEAAAALWTVLDENEAIAKDVVDLVEGTQPAPQAYLPADQPYVQPNENAPLLALAGWVYRADNPTHSEELFEKSLAMEEDHPSAFRGQMDFVFMWLFDNAHALHQPNRMIQLVREQAARTPWNDDLVPDAVSNLFATQADYGPDAGFTDDLRVYQQYFIHPEMVYVLSRLVARTGHPLVGGMLTDLAMAMSGLDAQDHFQAGEFLTEHGWNTEAERELKLCLFLPGGDQTNVYLKLSRLADERTDDLAAAKYMELGLKKNADSSGLVQRDRYGKEVPWPVDQAWAEVYMHYLRAAQQTHDLTAIQENLDKLLGGDGGQKMLASAPGIAADVVPALQSLGRNALADSIFDKAYTALEAEMTADPKDPMPKNNLAWLCACAGKRLDDAAKLAAQAVALAPDDGACLDTQAEVYMRLGQPAKAAEIETRALQARPDDVYMARQLKKFQAAAKQSH